MPFGKRSDSRIVTLNNTLYLLNNDVWCSTDGLNWQKVTDEIVMGKNIFGYSAQMFDNKIWLLGCNRNGLFTSQVLFSKDGKNWEELKAPWLPRGGVAAAVHRNKIYMTGGKYGGTPDHPDFRYDNDVWKLEKTGRSKNWLKFSRFYKTLFKLAICIIFICFICCKLRYSIEKGLINFICH